MLIDRACVLAIAALLDYGIGDPQNWLHPVQIMGWGISTYAKFVLKRLQSPLALRLAGVLLTVGLIGLSGGIGWAIVWFAHWLHPVLGLAIESIMLASCFAARSLRAAAESVLVPLSQGDRSEAQLRLSRYVGRDTENLSEPEILRAVLETVTENATDGVMAPLFYALLGALLEDWLPIGPVPLALAYKAVSTLDSMVGYREAPYTHLGWCSARTDDVLTWIPCRLVVFTIALLSGRSAQVWQLCRRDAPQDPSPNAGWSECAYAAALGVQMGGINIYRGVVKAKPLLGDAMRSITPAVIRQAMRLTRISFLTWLTIGIGLVAAIYRGSHHG